MTAETEILDEQARCSLTANEITARLLLEINKEFPVRVRRRNVGAAVTAGRLVKFGHPGEADITGIAKPGGVCIEIEVKAARDRLRPEQASFLRMIRDHGGIALVARNVEETKLALRAELQKRGIRA